MPLNYGEHVRLSEPKFADAWLSPTGVMYEVPRCGHAGSAAGVMRAANVTVSQLVGGLDDILESLGWMHCSKNRELYVNNESGHRPTQAQIDTLWDVFMDLNAQLNSGNVDAYDRATWERFAAQLRTLLGSMLV